MEIVKAKDINNALDLLSDGFAPMAGCTNLFVDIKIIRDETRKYVDITEIKELKHIVINENGLTAGALVTFATLEEALKDKAAYKALYDAAFVMGSPQIRNRATLAGNIADSSPACDTGAPLLVLGAMINVLSKDGKRAIPAEDFFCGVRKTALKENELITDIFIPDCNEKSFYKKVGTRNALAISTVSFAGAKKKNGEISLAMGSVAPTPVRLYNCEKLINGKAKVSEKDLSAALKKDISPIDDIRASKEYRMTAALNILKDSIEKEFGYEIV